MSFTSESRARSAPILPLAGMLDVMFLLLIFFMATSVLREQETTLPVDLQEAKTGQAGGSNIATNITVTVDPDSKQEKIYMAGFEYTLPELKVKLQEIAQSFARQPIVIRGDKNSSLGITVQIMDLCRSVGLTNVGIASRKNASDL